MFQRMTAALSLAAIVALAGACGDGEADAGEALEEIAAPPPDTTATALWAHVEGAEYRETWPLYPGKGRFYQGGEPHGMLLTTYVNDMAQSAVNDPAQTAMPAGAIIVKENYMPDSTLAAITVMYKAAGFDPDNNNWYWLKRNADGTVAAAGRGQGCINCHGSARANDFIMTSPLNLAPTP